MDVLILASEEFRIGMLRVGTGCKFKDAKVVVHSVNVALASGKRRTFFTCREDGTSIRGNCIVKGLVS